MAPIESGTYRIINVRHNAAITVLDHNPWAIIGRPIHKEFNQQVHDAHPNRLTHWLLIVRVQWFVQRSGEGYRFQNCLYGHYITIASTKPSARVYLGQYPPTWKILQDGEGSYVYVLPNGSNSLNSKLYFDLIGSSMGMPTVYSTCI